MESGEESHAELGPREATFITERDSFYMASVSETGWPYVQHRGGPRGFTRLELLGRAERIEPGQTELLAKLALPGYPAQLERGFLIHVEAFDWSCPQHITQRLSAAEVEAATAPLHARIAELEAQLGGRGAA